MSTVHNALQLEGIVKQFPGVRALDKVDLAVNAGEVHALMGENGAGKSTLMKVLGGIYQPNEGKVFLADAEVHIPNPLEAKKMGVVFIHQELSLAEELSVAENVFLGELPRKRFGRVDWDNLYAKTNDILSKLQVSFNAKSIVNELSIANQQMVEIARALTVDAKVVIFDEPTASLTDAEKFVLFEVIDDLKKQGVGIVYISHRMEEVFRIADRISVLRDGQYRGTLAAADTDENEITKLMIGRKLDVSKSLNAVKRGETVLEVTGLSCPACFSNVSFTVSAGEVVGFYGLVGAGRTEIAETLFGLRIPSEGKILLNGQTMNIHTPADAISHGISLVPENRKQQGLVLSMNCKENMTLPQVSKLCKGLLVSEQLETSIYDEYKQKLDLRASGWFQQTGNLSGGNQQKVVIAKWLAMRPKLLIVDEPTRGIDVGSKSEIHDLIRKLAKSGYGIIVISSEMPEVLRVSDTIVAMYHGKITRTFRADEVTEDNLIQAISGIDSKGEAA